MQVIRGVQMTTRAVIGHPDAPAKIWTNESRRLFGVVAWYQPQNDNAKSQLSHTFRVLVSPSAWRALPLWLRSSRVASRSSISARYSQPEIEVMVGTGISKM